MSLIDNLGEDSMENPEGELDKLIARIYKTEKYPVSDQFVVSDQLANQFAKEIAENCGVKAKNLNCRDCHYCYTIEITGKNLESDIQTNDLRMYLALSKLGNYAMIYWSVLKTRSFAFRRFDEFEPPDNFSQEAANCIEGIAATFGITVLKADVLREKYKVDYQGPIAGIDRNPEIWKLVFAEELH